MGDVIPTLPERFWAKARQVGDCWIWTAAKTRDGYGIFVHAGKTRSTVHRLAYEELIGRIPEGLVLDHLCRNRACVNPWHLDPVTNQKNTERGLVAVANSARSLGEKNPSAKLTPEQVREIRRRYAAGGVSQTALAEAFGVKQSQISRIVRGVSYAA